MTLSISDNPPMCHPVDILTRGLIQGVSWHAAYTKPRREKALAWNLHNMGINYYLPLVRKRQKSEKRLRRSYIPLFPGYLFFIGDAEDRQAVWKTDRIVRIIDVSCQNQLIKELNIIHKAVINQYRSARFLHGKLRTVDTCSFANGSIF